MKLSVASLVAAASVLLVPWTAHAQDATLSGVVTDATDAVLPGVTVTATHVDTGTTFVAVSEANGSYRIPTLRVAVYKAAAELSGFAAVTRENVQVLVGQNVVMNLKMGLSTVQESVTVTGQSPLIDTTASQLGGNIDPVQMQVLPVNGRNWMGLTILAP